MVTSLASAFVPLTDRLQGLTSFTYDANGNLLTVRDAKGQTCPEPRRRTTTHTYDALNRLATRTDPLSRTESFTYDLAGNLQTVTDRKGQVTTCMYDALSRRTQASYADATVATFTYDAASRLTQVNDTADPHRPITRTYDPLDRLLTETTSLGTVTYTYDTAGRRTSMTVGGQAPVSYTYDANARLRTITQAPLNPAMIDYDAANRRALLTLPNGVSTEYQYDLASRLTALVYRNALGPLGDLQYGYDAAGNRISVGGSYARTLVPVAETSSTYDAGNRQLAFGPTAQTFDHNGNLLTQTDPSGTITYTWDARNRLTAMTSPSVNASFAYDGVGRRAQKTIEGVTTAFRYDGLDVVAESTGGSDVSYLRTLSIDEAVTRTDAIGTAHYLADALGSTVALADGSGTAVTSYSYEPFGSTGVTGSASPNPLQFTGRENEGMGLYYYRARYYNVGAGRFTQEDPIRFAGGGTNLFAYVRNSPINLIDPTGLRCAYSQSTGSMVCTDNQTGHIYYSAMGYSGTGPGRNNPEMQGVPDVGPIPRGEWEVSGGWYNSPNTGPNTIRLAPRTNNECPATRRDCDSFRVHGNNAQNDASRGCIVLPPNRTTIPTREIIEVVR